MDLLVKIVAFVGLIGHLNLVNSTAMLSSSASASSLYGNYTLKTTYYTGLLSDILYTNRENDLSITPLCNQQLTEIQRGLNMRDIWAIKRKYLVFGSVHS